MKKVPEYRLTDPEKIAKESKIHDITTVSHKHPEHKPNRMKKAINFLKGLVTGESKAGEAVHGILDLLPIPNQVIAKAASYLFGGEPQKSKEELSKLLTFRNGVALVLSIAYLTGLITLEDMRAVLEAVGEFV